MAIIKPVTESFEKSDTIRSLYILDKNNPFPPKSILKVSKSEETIIWTLDKEGVFTFSEGDGLGYLGYKPGGLVGESVFHLFDKFPDLIKCVRRAFKGKSCQTIDEINGYLWKMWFYPMKDAEGEVTGLSGVFVNITEQYQRERVQKIILNLSNLLRNIDARSEIPGIVLDQIMKAVFADAAMLFWRDSVVGGMRVDLGRGHWAHWSGANLEDEDKISNSKAVQRVIQQGKTYLGNEAEFCSSERKDFTVFGVPLISMGRVNGAIWVGRKNAFTNYEILLMKSIGEMVSDAIHRAIQHTTTQRRLQRLVALHNVDKAISNSLELKVTLNVLLEQVVTQLGIHAAAIYLVKPFAQGLEFAVGRGLPISDFSQRYLPFDNSLAGRVAISRRHIHISDLLHIDENLARKRFFKKEKIVSYMGLPLIVKGQVKGVIEIFHKRMINPEPEWIDFLETLATQAAIAIDNAELFQNLQRTNAELSVAYDSTLEGWVHALDLRDKETEGHTQRVTEVTLRLARALGVGESDLMHIWRGALLHDIGKMAIPDAILYKPGPLTDEEWEVMRKHPVYAYELLSPIRFLKPALDIPYYHHEKWDGTGYPFGLKGEQIPKSARIFAVADVWDALRSDRPYRKAWKDEEARAYLRENAGKHFDPEVIRVFFKIF